MMIKSVLELRDEMVKREAALLVSDQGLDVEAAEAEAARLIEQRHPDLHVKCLAAAGREDKAEE